MVANSQEYTLEDYPPPFDPEPAGFTPGFSFKACAFWSGRPDGYPFFLEWRATDRQWWLQMDRKPIQYVGSIADVDELQAIMERLTQDAEEQESAR